MKRKIVYLVIALFLIVVAIVFSTSRDGLVKSGWPKKPTPTPIPVEEKLNSLSLAGEIKAEREVNLKFKTSGKLVWVGVKKGDRIKKWQAVASLDKKQLEKTFKKEMNDYMNERWDFEQTQDDYQETKERYLITDEIKRILEKAQFDLNNSILDAEIADLAVKYSTLVSPIGGLVTRVDQPIAGVNITPATAVFTVSDPDSLYFEAEADEEDVVQISEGMEGTIVLDAYPEENIKTKILSIDFAPISGETSTVYAAKFSLPENKNLRFRIGMAGEIELPLND